MPQVGSSLHISDQIANSQFEYAGIMMQKLTQPYEVINAVVGQPGEGSRVISFSTREKDRVQFSLKDMMAQLKRMNIPIESVTAIVHNHPKGQDFGSSDDYKALEGLRSNGFTGNYQVYAGGKARFVTLKGKKK